MSHHISNERMSAFLDTISKQVREALHERADDMLKAWHENIEEAQANEKNFPPLKVGISSSVDLETNKIETVIRFTATYQTSISAALPDPNQPELPIDGLRRALGPDDEMTISVDGKEITTIKGK